MVSSNILRSRVIQKPYQLFHYYFLSEKQYGSILSDLSFETDIKLSIHKFKNRQWSWSEVFHYSFLSFIIFFVFLIFPAPFLMKAAIFSLFLSCFLVPLTSQFFVHALPIFTWLALFFSAGKIPNTWKPAISVKLLPAMETILYGDNLSNVLAEINTSFLDIVAWLPYGIIHFSSPFIVAAFIFIFAPPTSLRSFGFAFGYMNLVGLLTQILFPAAPPWYKNLHGLEPADYSMSGSPGGLGRIDALLGFDMYTTAFSNSPVVFGAFPSLHSGCAVMDVLFLCWLFPKYKYVWWGYATWLWWSTMYLTHHYFIDLIGGAVLSLSVFTYTKYQHLPIIDHNKFCRWSYTAVHHIHINSNDPLNSNYAFSSINPSTDDLEASVFPTTTQPGYPLGNYQRSLSSSNLDVSNNNDVFEMSGLSRSRQTSRSYVGAVPVTSVSGGISTSHNNSTTSLGLHPDSNSQGNLLDPSTFRNQGKSSSSLNLSLVNDDIQEMDEEDHHHTNDELETDNSTTNSMFENDAEQDERHQISSTASSTSLDDLEGQQQQSASAGAGAAIINHTGGVILNTKGSQPKKALNKNR